MMEELQMTYEEMRAGEVYLSALVADMQQSARGIPDEERAGYFGGWVGRLETKSLLDVCLAAERAREMGAMGAGFLARYVGVLQDLEAVRAELAEANA